jgi:steroid 5-alpha reductase family enzyme
MIRKRLASAFLLIGLIFLVVFLVTRTNHQASLSVLLVGLASSLFGLILRKTARKRAEHPRFRSVRRIMAKSRPSDEEPEQTS